MISATYVGLVFRSCYSPRFITLPGFTDHRDGVPRTVAIDLQDAFLVDIYSVCIPPHAGMPDCIITLVLELCTLVRPVVPVVIFGMSSSEAPFDKPLEPLPRFYPFGKRFREPGCTADGGLKCISNASDRLSRFASNE